MVKHCHANEVIELCKTIKEDMFKYMTYQAAEEIFEDVESIQEKASSHTLWEPYTMPNHFEEAIDEKNDENSTLERKHNKRASEQSIHKYPKQSYANAVGTNSTIKPPPQSSSPPETRQSSIQHTINVKTKETLNSIQQHLLKLEAKQQEHEAKQQQNATKADKSTAFLLSEIKRTNESTQESVILAMEKTNYEVTKIQRQMAQVVTKNESFHDVLQYMRFKMSQDDQYKQPTSCLNDDMQLDKDSNKRNLHEILLDDNGNLHSSYHDKENIATGGNQSNCAINGQNYFGHHSP
jgi:hypothetical protein